MQASLPELLDRLEQVLTQVPARPSFCKALSDLHTRLGATGKVRTRNASRARPARRERQVNMESLPLFS
ncbi:MAG: hypothetical protein CPDRYMAC_6404 [uncultured Paraburkholderia sp.]|nr:MAG: hypothetical protein CPDRYDRY_6330 [uncultured Paraburkholderia sp.]CAH2944375.1 MAG: hypothetical protein CPDRYMAC_6404 [uncultured Paraburkholderia sp.]